MTSRLDAQVSAARRGDSVRRRDYCGAVRYVGEAAASVPVADAVSAYESADGFLRMTGRINGCGVYQYEDEAGNTWGELRLPEHVFADSVLAGWKLAPLTDDHPDEFVTADNWSELAKGGLGSDVRPDEAKEYTLADIGCNDADLIAKVKSGKTALSCGYLTKLVESPGEYNGVPYRFIQTEYVPNHVSVVDEARGPGCEFVIDGVRSVRSRPTEQPKGDERTTHMGDPKKNDEGEMPDDTADLKAMVAALMALVEEQGAKLAALSAEGDADEPAPPADPPVEAAPMDGEMPKPDSKGKPVKSTDALEARLLMLEDENKKLAAKVAEDAKSLGPKVDARVNLLSRASKVLGSAVSLDGKSDTEIKRLVIAKVAPTVDKALAGKSTDAVDTAFDMALEQHARSMDSSAELLGVVAGARPVRTTDGVDLNAAAKAAMDSLKHSYNKPSRQAALEN